jgi:hypothetical protein
MDKLFDRFSWRVLVGCALFAGIFNLLPIMTGIIFGDTMLNYMLMHCFGDQMWSGHFNPRWCMNGNMGLGSPAPFFYFPLPFYFAGLFYPLQALGLSNQHFYMLLIGLINILAFITCTLWLSRITRFRAALFCSFVMLWLPYRMDAESGRSSYAELCCMALLPLLFMKLSQVGASLNKDWPVIAFLIAVCILCHAPITFLGLFACGFILLFTAERRFQALAILFGCALLALGATLFHWQQATGFSNALNDAIGGVQSWRKSWLNGFIDNPTNFQDRPLNILVNYLMVVASFAFAFLVYCKRSLIETKHHRQLAYSWIATAVFASIMTLSFTEPLWDLIEYFTKVRTPWRMLMLVMFALVFFIAVASRYIPLIKNRSRGDAIISLMLIILFGAVNTSEVKQESVKQFQELMKSELVLGYYSTRWLDSRYARAKEDLDKYYQYFREHEEKAEFAGEVGKIEVTQWSYDALMIETDNKKPDTLIVRQFYFPNWHATLDDEAVELKPEKMWGRISLMVPPGKHVVKLYTDTASALPESYRYVKLVSLLSSIVIGLGLFCRWKCFDKKLSHQ